VCAVIMLFTVLILRMISIGTQLIRAVQASWVRRHTSFWMSLAQRYRQPIIGKQDMLGL